MATTIKLKNGSGAPLAGDLVQGEPALDLTNKRLYTEDSGGTVIEVGTNPTSLTTTTVSATGSVTGQKLVASDGLLELDDNGTHNGIINVPASLFINIDSDNTNTGEDFVIAKDRTSASGGTELFRVQEDGNVGIGTSSPQYELSFGTGYFGLNYSTGKLALYQANSTSHSTAVESLGSVEISSSITGSGSGAVKFNTFGSERMRIDSSGNVGIGTASPADELHINNDSANVNLRLTRNTATGARISGSDGALTPAIIFETIASSTATERMRIDSNGQTMLAGSTAAFDNTGAVNGLQFHYTTTTGKGVIGTYSSGGSTSLAFRTNSGGAGAATDNMIIDSSGNVGIGTSSPVAPLHVKVATNENVRIAGGSGDTRISAINDASSATTQFSVQGDPLIFRTFGGSEMARIDSSGNVGIGTSSPSGTFHSKVGSGGSGTLGQAVFGYLGGSTHYLDANTIIFRNGSEAESMRIDSSGRLMIGTTTPISTNAYLNIERASGNAYAQSYTASITNGEQALWQAGARASGTSADRYCAISVYKHSGITNAAPYLYLQEEDGNAAYYWTDNTGVLKYSNSAANVGTTGGGAVGAQTSDERLKNIEEGFEYGIETIKALTPIAYRRNDEESPKRKLGFGAQTTQAIVPEVVFDTGDCLDGYDGEGLEATPKTDNTILGMEYVQLIPVLTKAIQEQQAMIETLQAQVAELQGA